jgi:hypothetical protein
VQQGAIGHWGMMLRLGFFSMRLETSLQSMEINTVSNTFWRLYRVYGGIGHFSVYRLNRGRGGWGVLDIIKYLFQSILVLFLVQTYVVRAVIDTLNLITIARDEKSVYTESHWAQILCS